MTFWVAGAVVGSALIGSSASRGAASTQAAAAGQAADISNQQYYQTREDQRPFREMGIRALPQLEAQRNMMPGAFTGQVNLGQDPGYAFRLSEGQKALDRSTSQVGAAGATNAANVGNYLTSGAAANAAGQVGTANAITGGLSTYLNYNQGQNLVNALRGTTPGYSNAGNASQMGAPYGYSDQGFGQYAGDWTQGGTWAP